MGPGEAFAMITFFLSLAAVVVLRGPLGKALAERISGRGSEAEGALKGEIEKLGTEVDDLRHRLAETEERLDFAERMPAKQKHPPVLPEG